MPEQLAWLGALLALLAVLSVPIFLISANVRWVTLDPNTYADGFRTYRAAERTGLSAKQLEQVGQAFREYFQAPPGRLEVAVTLNGQSRSLFNEREIAHLEDVQHLMQLVFRLGALTGLLLLVGTVAALLWRREQVLPMLGTLALWGSGLTLLLLVVMAGLSLLDFGELFVRFHQLSFRNDLWMLDPRRDYLLILFPEGFWLDVTLRIAALTAVEALALGGLGFFLARR